MRMLFAMSRLPDEPTSSLGSQAERAFFDTLVAESGQFDPFTDAGWEVLAEQFATFVRRDAPADILEVGAGTGASRRIYRAKARCFTGIDLSPNAIGRARQQFPNDNWLIADACALPFEADAFDVIAFSSVLHHMPDYSLAIREAFRVLRPGGNAFAFDPNLLHPGMAVLRHPTSPFYLSEGVSPNERPLLPVSLRRAFTAAGFEGIRQRCRCGIIYRSVAPSEISRLLAIYNMADRLLAFCGLDRLVGTFVITAGTKPSLCRSHGDVRSHAS